MDELPDNSVQMVCTSPPYWNLRKYSGEQDLIWDGDNCEHEWGEERIIKRGHPGNKATLVGTQTADLSKAANNQGSFCSLCGAWRGQLGQEPTMELYIQHLIEIMREIKRVLRKDGTFFLNIGDCYAGSGSPGGDFRDGKGGDEYLRPYNRKGGVLKPLDMCLIPFRVAIAAQEDGWWVRSVLIWSKPNPMPESINGWRMAKHRIKVGNRGCGKEASRNTTPGRPQQDHDGRDFKPDTQWEDCPGCPKCSPNDGLILRKGSWRPTRSHEYILMLTKTDTYYCGGDAVRELSTERPSGNKECKYRRDYGGPEAHTGRQGFSIPYEPNGAGRNLRSVWTFPTVPFPSFKIDGKKVEHFAVFPEKLPELCIKAATPEVGCCSKCGAPWARVIKRGFTNHDGATRTAYPEGSSAKRLALLRQAARAKGAEYQNISETIGWRPTCTCQAEKVPSLILDPFMGAGTTLAVAKKLNRYAIGYELSQEYCQLTVERCRQQVLV